MRRILRTDLLKVVRLAKGEVGALGELREHEREMRHKAREEFIARKISSVRGNGYDR